MDRPHAPTPRRRSLARAAGRVLTSPAVSTALAFAAGTLALLAIARAAARTLLATTRDQLSHAGDEGAVTRATTAASAVPLDVVAIAAPIAIAAMSGALLGHAAVARGLWIPIRTVRGAPATGADATSASERAGDAAVSLLRAAVVTAAGIGVFLAALPGLSALTARAGDAAGGRTGVTTGDGAHAIASASSGAAPLASAFGAVAGATLAAIAIAALATAVLELAVRHRRLGRAIAMTDRELRDDTRDAHGDPAVRRHRRAARDDDRALLTGARVVVVGDALAVAIAWPAGDRPHPLRIARALDARRLLTAARAARTPIVADATLAVTLAASPRTVPDDALPAVAALLAAVGVRA